MPVLTKTTGTRPAADHEPNPYADLDTLARRLDARERGIAEHIVQHARQQGLDLIRARGQIGPRQFAPWLEESGFPFSRQTAYTYMKVARNWWRIRKAPLPITLSAALELIDSHRVVGDADDTHADAPAAITEPERGEAGPPAPPNRVARPATDIRQYKLVLPANKFKRLGGMVRFLAKEYKLTPPEAVFKAVEWAYQREVARG